MTGRVWVVWRRANDPETSAPDLGDADLAGALQERVAAGDTVEVREHPLPGRVSRALRQIFGRGAPRPYAGGPVDAVHLATGGVEGRRAEIGRATGAEVATRADGLILLVQAARWDAVDRLLRVMAARAEREPLRPSELLRALRALGGADPALSAVSMTERLPRLRTVCRRLIRQNRYAQAAELLDLALPAWDPEPDLGLHALAAHASTSLTGRAPEDLLETAAAALRGADRALAAGDLEVSAELVVIGAGLLLHRDLHADAERSPLVDDTAAFLAPVRQSRAMAALAAPWAAASAPGQGDTLLEGGETMDRPRRVVVLPGAYPRFAAALIAALRRRPDLEVQVVELIEDHASFRWLGTDPELVRLRLAGGVGDTGPWPTRPDRPPLPAVHGQALVTTADQPFAVTPEELAAVREADVVVADWADKGAVWASLVVPRSTRLVVRVHGMDALGLWPHVMDWSGVDALVAVSPHQGGIIEDVLRHGAPRAPAPPPARVVPNIVRLPTVPDPPPRDPHTLVLIGWANRVKDPLWAVEVLAGLLDRGGDWQLVLVGTGFRPGRVVTSQEYADAFAERARQPDVAAHIRHVPQTDDVAIEVAQVGFVLSASIRESFHQGLVEGVLGGAVPVVRNWPYVASRDGARRLYPPGWVVDDVAAAVERIWALRDPTDRTTAAEQARAQVSECFDPEQVETDLVRVVLGESPER